MAFMMLLKKSRNRADREPEHQLEEGEPRDAGGLHHEEGSVNKVWERTVLLMLRLGSLTTFSSSPLGTQEEVSRQKMVMEMITTRTETTATPRAALELSGYSKAELPVERH